MVKRNLLKILPWVVLIGVISWGLFFLTPKDPPFQVKREMLIHRLEKLERLEVMQVHLLAHENVQANRFLNQSEFLIIAHGRAIYGIDLSTIQIKPQAKNGIELILPKVTVLELVLNPQDIEYLGLKKGLLTSQQKFEGYKQQALQSLHNELKNQAYDPELLRQAEQSVEQYLEGVMDTLAIKNAKISFQHSLHQKIRPNGDAGEL